MDLELVRSLWPIVALSLEIALATVVIASVIGVPAGVWLGLSRFRGKRLIETLAYTGMALPPVVVGSFLYLLLSHSGPLGRWGWLFTPKAMVLAQVILSLPFVVGVTTSTIGAVPGELARQLASLGASAWQVRWTILREARHGILLAIVTAFGRSMSEVGAVLIVGGNIEGHTRVMTTAIVLETSKGDFAAAVALGLVLLSIALSVNLLIVRLIGRPAL